MKLAKETLHIILYSLYSGTPKLWLGLQFFIKEESRTAVFKILVRTLGKNKLHNIILNNNKGKTAAYSVKEYKMKIILYKFSPIHSFPYTFFPLYILSPKHSFP